MKCYTEIREAAEALDFDKVKALYNDKKEVHMLNMAIVGAGNTFERKQEQEKCKLILQWATGLGGCMLFFTKKEEEKEKLVTSSEKPDSFFTRVSMRKGPGEVRKGTFKKDE
jgi:hypothetical protein